jgi:two-component system KDP operon response regulator KdpE
VTHKVLVVDDDPQILRTLRINLSANGYRVVARPGRCHGAAGRRRRAPRRDRPRPRPAGHGRHRRDRGRARLDERADHRAHGAHGGAETVRALDAGADDYVTKPFGMASCSRACGRPCGARPCCPSTARPWWTRATLRRRPGREEGPARGRHAKCISPRPSGGVLELLVRHRGKLVGQRELLRAVWGTELRVRDELPARLRRPAAPQAGATPRQAEAPDHRAGQWATVSSPDR